MVNKQFEGGNYSVENETTKATEQSTQRQRQSVSNSIGPANEKARSPTIVTVLDLAMTIKRR